MTLRRISIASLFMTILLLFSVGSELVFPQAAARRIALLIGNSAYQKNALPNPANDASDFGAMLAEAGFAATVKTDLDLRGLEAAVRDFAVGLHEGDTVLVFYAGHGVESGGVNYLIPVDNAGLQSEADLKYKAYAASRILEEVAARKADLAILVLDACRDNPFPSRSSLGSRGLTVMAAPAQLESLILFSTAPGTTAADGVGRNSVFMRSLLAEIQTPDLSVREVFDRVGGAVKAATGGAQVPWLNSTPLSKPFVFFSGAEAERRAASLSAMAQSELVVQRAKIADLEGGRAKAKDEAGRQKLDTELATARALEAAKKLESDRLTAESARLSEERKRAEAAEMARRDFEASEAAKTAAMKDEAARLRIEYESLVRADDSAPEFIHQINALEKALREIWERYNVIRRDGEKGIAAVYAQKAEALKASLVIEPWENDKEFSDRTKVAYSDLDSKRWTELETYGQSISAEQNGQEKELRDKLDKVSGQFKSTVYTQSGSSLTLTVGVFNRDTKAWPIKVESTAPNFFFNTTFNYSIASAPDIAAAYRAFDAAAKARALAVEVEYVYSRMTGQEYSPVKSKAVHIKDLTTGKIIVSVESEEILFYLAGDVLGEKIGVPVLRLSGVLKGSLVIIDGRPPKEWSGDIELDLGMYSVEVRKAGYSLVAFSGEALPGQLIEMNIEQKVGLSLDMVYVPGGTFSMDSASGDSIKQPMHQVTVSSFRMGAYEVTQEQYQQVIGTNPSRFSSGLDAPKRPVEQVSWYDAVAFCNRLSEMEGLQKVYTISGIGVRADFSQNGYRLPTEAEWEYAARGGQVIDNYAGSSYPDNVAWYIDNASYTTHPVGTKTPNELGLYDMSGNVWEWCWDWYGSYSGDQQADPQGASSNSYRVSRGGSWFNTKISLQSAYRYCYSPGNRFDSLGFRVVRRP